MRIVQWQSTCLWLRPWVLHSAPKRREQCKEKIMNKYNMDKSLCYSRKTKTYRQKADLHHPRLGRKQTAKGHKKTFYREGTVLYLDCGGDYISVYSCLKPLSCPRNFFAQKICLNKIQIIQKYDRKSIYFILEIIIYATF